MEIKVGDVFGNWTVKEILPKSGKHQYYIVECSCENKSVRKLEKYVLVKWNKDYCSKCRPREDKSGIEVGKIYGNWLVLRKDEEETKKRWASCFVCECQCEFKTTQILEGWQLKGKNSNCCMKCVVKNRRNDIKVGDKYGHWTVLKEDGKQYTNIMYLCECDCEFKTQMRQRANYLVGGGDDISCQKCCQYNRQEDGSLTYKPNLKNRKGVGLMSGSYYKELQLGAIKRSIDFDILCEDVYEEYLKQRGYCALTGMFLIFDDFRRNFRTASADRIDNYKGYTKGNIRFVHRDINLVRGDLSDEELLYFCHLIIEHTYKKFEPIDYKIPEHGNGWQGIGDLGKTAWTEVEKRAANYNRELELTIEDGWELAKTQGFRCALTGLPLEFGYKGEANASLDRIDSNKGYTKDNVQWIHKTVNRMKWHLDQNYFIWLCRQAYEYNQLNSNVYSFI